MPQPPAPAQSPKGLSPFGVDSAGSGLFGFGEPRARMIGRRLDALFAAQAAVTPNATALIHQGLELTYAELDRRANRLGHRLQELGVGPDVLTGVCLERSSDLVIAILAVLKAGGAYLPLDPAYPAARLGFMLQDSGAAVMISRAGLHSNLAFDGALLDLELEAPLIASRPASPVPSKATADHLAYVIYTSGSTGRPKGVMLTHTAAALVEWALKTYTRAELSRVAAVTSICFDPSVFELFVPLCTGGAVIMKYNALDPFDDDERPSMLCSVPSALTELARCGMIPDSVKVINSGGERLTGALVNEIYQSSKVKRVLNHYGPTEATTCVAVASAPKGARQDPPIGRPICGARLYVLDEAGASIRAGEVGELYIGGPTLARGYLNRPEQTAERFLPDPFVGGQARMYRTGDFVRWAKGGQLEFVGRTDQQVKLRGYRVELGEVEAALARLPSVRRATAMVQRTPGGEDTLCAWLETDGVLRLPDVRQMLRAQLPEPMIPTALVCLESLPVLPSGKIDREALRAGS
jgi:amino acid adenylation domain-containing protein